MGDLDRNEVLGEWKGWQGAELMQRRAEAMKGNPAITGVFKRVRFKTVARMGIVYSD